MAQNVIAVKKQLEREKKKAAAKEAAKKRGGIVANSGDTLDRNKQKFDVSKLLNLDDDNFAEIVHFDPNPKFTAAYTSLRKRSTNFILTMNEDMIETEDESASSDDEVQQTIHELVHKSNTLTKTLYQGEASSRAA